MELWGLLVVYLVAFALIHVVLYLLYSRRGGDSTSIPSLSEGGVGNPYLTSSIESVQAGDRPSDDAEDRRRCVRCGVANEADASYTYCRNCIAPLR